MAVKGLKYLYYRLNKENLIVLSVPMSNSTKDSKKTWIRNLKASSGCDVCGESRYYCLDFHHKDPLDKSGEISKMISNDTSMRKVLIEVSKCRVLCANCHREVHHKDLMNGIRIEQKEIEDEIMLWDI